MPGYYKKPDVNAQSFRGDFFRTGDICYCSSKSKKWYIVGREKELIKVRGFQVAPIEVEGVLMSHPSVVDAAVIGIPGAPLSALEGPDARKLAASTAAGELVRAYIVMRPDKQHRLDEKAILDYTSTRLSSFKRITGGIVFIKEIPKNANGKILRRVLLEEYERERKIEGAAELSRL
jgi:acyl-CoA synthetase (AMP-forming)/AMP-acid ligase II